MIRSYVHSYAPVSVDRLRRLVESAPALGPDGEWLAAALQRYLAHAHEGVTLDQVLGVAAVRGAWPWWRCEKRDREREAAQALVNAFGDPREAHRALRQFASGRGRFPQRDYQAATTQAASDYLSATRGKVPAHPRTLDRAVAGDRSCTISCHGDHDPMASR